MENKNENIELSLRYEGRYTYLSLPENLVNALMESKSEKTKELEIKKYIEESKLSFRADLEGMEEEVLTYKHLMTTAKNRFKEAKEEHINATFEVWEKFEDQMPPIQEKVSKMIKEMKPIIELTEKLETTLKRINLYDLEKVISAINKFNSLYGEEKEIFDFIIKNYKKD